MSAEKVRSLREDGDYWQWKRQMEKLLIKENVWDIVSGEERSPEEPEESSSRASQSVLSLLLPLNKSDVDSDEDAAPSSTKGKKKEDETNEELARAKQQLFDLQKQVSSDQRAAVRAWKKRDQRAKDYLAKIDSLCAALRELDVEVPAHRYINKLLSSIPTDEYCWTIEHIEQNQLDDKKSVKDALKMGYRSKIAQARRKTHEQNGGYNYHSHGRHHKGSSSNHIKGKEKPSTNKPSFNSDKQRYRKPSFKNKQSNRCENCRDFGHKAEQCPSKPRKPKTEQGLQNVAGETKALPSQPSSWERGTLFSISSTSSTRKTSDPIYLDSGASHHFTFRRDWLLLKAAPYI
ncbi:hypothetical protein QOT17_000939 [Balamuthia mandrillaris]